MVRTYGLARENGDPSSHVAGTAEGDPLLGPTVKPSEEGHATIKSSVGNLMNTIIGSGV
jgi:hypothetical protein